MSYFSSYISSIWIMYVAFCIVCCNRDKATKSMSTHCEPCWKCGSQAASSFSVGDHSPNVPSPSLSLLIIHTQKSQIPQDTNSLSQNNYKMLYATVNTTSVTVTVCICHEMRQKQNEFALVNRTREEEVSFCVACYGRLFQPHHK